MNRSLLMLGSVIVTVVVLGHQANAAEPAIAVGDPVNSLCPIGKEPINPNAPTVEHKGHTIAFCCAGCDDAFLKWSEERKDAFVASALGGHDRQSERHAEGNDPETNGDPYTLDTCPVSGQKLGSMGEPIVKKYDGREVRFCCAGCIDRFEADQERYIVGIDKDLIESQMPFYPIDKCIVMGSELGSMGKPIDYIHNNRLVRFCCKGCLPKFKEDPAPYLKKLDEAVIARQREHYPLNNCMVMDSSELGSMGDPVEIIVANRLVQFCCGGCEKGFMKNPDKFIMKLDHAWKEHGHMPGVGGDDDGHGG